MSYLIYPGWVFYLFIFLLGLALGSFLNSWIWRTRENIMIVKGRSMCPQCRRQLTWYENIPVLSYLVLRGRCRTCKNYIPWHFTFVELSTALLFLLVAWLHVNFLGFNSLHFFRDITFVVLLIIIFMFDALYGIILSEVVWFGALTGFIANYFYLHYSLKSLFIGMIIGGGFFLLQFIVSKGKWIGGGDVRMGVMMGAWLGWPGILVALGLSYLFGSVISLSLIGLKKRKISSSTPFGTYLAIGTFITMFWGGVIVSWYMNLLQ